MGESIAEVAAGLTLSQRQVLLKIGNGRRRAIDFSGATAAAMRFPNSRRPALTDRDMTSKHGIRIATYRLTDAGLAIRTHLISQGADHDR